MHPLVARCIAYVLDIALLFLVLAPAGWLVQQALGIHPASGPQIWATLLLNFSLPAWTYFTLHDARSGSTPGKRWLCLRVTDRTGQRLSPPRALLRTAVKLFPWELTHLAVFGLARSPDEFTPPQWAGLVTANALVLVYLLVAATTRGQRSVHDYAAGTEVRPLAAQPPA